MPAEDPVKKEVKGRILWFWVVLAFVVLISAWTALILIASRNQPEIIQLEEGPGTGD